MRVALFIGVSKYQNLNDLPACEADVELMARILRGTQEYEDEYILVPTLNAKSADIRQKVFNWIESLSNQDVDEVFFYFTGHGVFRDGEFYYPLFDFSDEKRRQTCITNSELDAWLKSLNPKLTVKVVDACQAGIQYIKHSSDGLEKYLRSSQGSFKNCYFMFSSGSDQSSYQDYSLSFFTRSFAAAIAAHSTDTIRYPGLYPFD